MQALCPCRLNLMHSLVEALVTWFKINMKQLNKSLEAILCFLDTHNYFSSTVASKGSRYCTTVAKLLAHLPMLVCCRMLACSRDTDKNAKLYLS